MSTSYDNSVILNLFRERNIIEIKDYNLELSNKTDKLGSDFRDQLFKNYKNILKVTDNVNNLFLEMKNVDVSFTDLCFNDDIYKLQKLSEFQIDNRNKNDVKNDGETDSSDFSSLDNAKMILLLSNWSISITVFMKRFASSSTSSNIFQKALSNFEELGSNLSQFNDYEKSIEDKCKEFQYFILESSYSGSSAFTLEQWIKLYYLFNNYNYNFPWDKSNLKIVESIIFESIFQFDQVSLFKASNELIIKFVKSDAFKFKYIETIENKIKTKFNRLDTLLQDGLTNNNIANEISLFSLSASATYNVSDIVENSHLYSLGLTTSKRIELYNITEPILGLLHQLMKNGGSTIQLKKYKDKLIIILKDIIPKKTSHNEEEEIKLSDNFVNNFVSRTNDMNFTKLITNQIEALDQLK